MILDSTLQFSSQQNISSATTITTSTTVIDLAGVGSGNALNATFGTAKVFGQDLGVGGGMADLVLAAIVGTQFASTNTATLTIALQGAIDNGSNSPGTWVTYQQSGALSVSNLASNTMVFRCNLADAVPFGTLPRFLRMQFSNPASTNWTTGSISYAGVLTNRDDYSARYYPSGFTVA